MSASPGDEEDRAAHLGGAADRLVHRLEAGDAPDEEVLARAGPPDEVDGEEDEAR